MLPNAKTLVVPNVSSKLLSIIVEVAKQKRRSCRTEKHRSCRTAEKVEVAELKNVEVAEQ